MDECVEKKERVVGWKKLKGAARLFEGIEVWVGKTRQQLQTVITQVKLCESEVASSGLVADLGVK